MTDILWRVWAAVLWVVLGVLLVALVLTLTVALPKELADKSACEKRGGVFIDNGCYDLKVK